MTVEGERARRENSMKNFKEDCKRTCRREREMVMGDVNAHLGILSEPMSRNSEMLAEFMDEMNLENLNETLAEGRVTWSAKNQESAIDFVLVNGKMRESVTRM